MPVFHIVWFEYLFYVPKLRGILQKIGSALKITHLDEILVYLSAGVVRAKFEQFVQFLTVLVLVFYKRGAGICEDGTPRRYQHVVGWMYVDI